MTKRRIVTYGEPVPWWVVVLAIGIVCGAWLRWGA